MKIIPVSRCCLKQPWLHALPLCKFKEVPGYNLPGVCSDESSFSMLVFFVSFVIHSLFALMAMCAVLRLGSAGGPSMYNQPYVCVGISFFFCGERGMISTGCMWMGCVWSSSSSHLVARIFKNIYIAMASGRRG
jgi:hypothetical protein